MIIPFENKSAQINDTNYIAPGAIVIGDVKCGEHTSIWFNAVLRGDDNYIQIGSHSNIQDLVCIHTEKDYPTIIGDNVTIGHHAMVHGCQIGNNCIIGINSTILDNVKIGNNCIIGANSLITANKEIPDHSIAFGNPLKIYKQTTVEDIEKIKASALHYVELAKKYHK